MVLKGMKNQCLRAYRPSPMGSAGQQNEIWIVDPDEDHKGGPSYRQAS